MAGYIQLYRKQLLVLKSKILLSYLHQLEQEKFAKRSFYFLYSGSWLERVNIATFYCSTNKMHRSLHQLPVLIIYRIFDHLEDKALVLSIYAVCQRLNSVIHSYDRFKVKFFLNVWWQIIKFSFFIDSHNAWNYFGSYWWSRSTISCECIATTESNTDFMILFKESINFSFFSDAHHTTS